MCALRHGSGGGRSGKDDAESGRRHGLFKFPLDTLKRAGDVRASTLQEPRVYRVRSEE
jgi:hypothetical protein